MFSRFEQFTCFCIWHIELQPCCNAGPSLHYYHYLDVQHILPPSSPSLCCSDHEALHHAGVCRVLCGVSTLPTGGGTTLRHQRLQRRATGNEAASISCIHYTHGTSAVYEPFFCSHTALFQEC